MKRRVILACVAVAATVVSIAGVASAQAPTTPPPNFNPYGTPVNGCDNPILATDAGGWGTDTAGATATRGQPGDHIVANWDFNLHTTNAGGARIWMPRRNVVPGQTWEFSADTRTGSDPATALIQADWFNSSGTYLRSDTAPAVAVDGTRAYTRVAGTFTAPAGAAQATALVVMSNLNANSGFATTMCTYRPGTPTSPPTTTVPPVTTVPPTTTVTPPPPNNGNPIFNGDFETGNFNQWPLCQTHAYNGACSGMPADYSLSIEHPGHQGNSQARFEVRDGDQPFCCGERAQLVGPANETEGKDLWYTWSGMVDPTTFPVNDSWQVLMQWHSTQDGSPPLTFDVEGNNLVLETRPRANEPYTGITNIWTTPLNRGQWHDIKVHVKWSANTNVGFVELWQGGVRQTFTATPPENSNGVCSGTQTCHISNIYPGDAGNRPMVTYYRDAGINGTGVVHHDNFRVANTEADLGTSPANPNPPVSSTTNPPPPTGDPTQAGVARNWGTPKFTDDFNRTTIGSNWSLYNGTGHGGNGRRVPSAWSINGQYITVTGASNGDSGGASLNQSLTRGRIETRMRASAGDKDYHPVLLLWPNAEDWPQGGEVDYSETFAANRQQVNFFLHYSASNQQTSASKAVDVTQWHNYAVDWNASCLTGYIDNVQWFQDCNTSHLPPRAMHPTIQLDAFRGTGPYQVSTMDVDWMKLY